MTTTLAFAAPAGYVSRIESGSNFSNSLAGVEVAGSVMTISEIGNADAFVALTTIETPEFSPMTACSPASVW